MGDIPIEKKVEDTKETKVEPVKGDEKHSMSTINFGNIEILKIKLLEEIRDLLQELVKKEEDNG